MESFYYFQLANYGTFLPVYYKDNCLENRHFADPIEPVLKELQENNMIVLGENTKPKKEQLGIKVKLTEWTDWK